MVVAHTYNPRDQKAEEEGSQVQVWPVLHNQAQKQTKTLKECFVIQENLSCKGLNSYCEVLRLYDVLNHSLGCICWNRNEKHQPTPSPIFLLVLLIVNEISCFWWIYKITTMVLSISCNRACLNVSSLCRDNGWEVDLRLSQVYRMSSELSNYFK